MLGRDEHHVMDALAGNFEPGHVERLREHIAVDCQCEELPETLRIDVARREDRLAQIGAGAGVVVLGGENRTCACASADRSRTAKL